MNNQATLLHQDAISDCKYMLSLGGNALTNHLSIWKNNPPEIGSMDWAYYDALAEIELKLNTNECHLKGEI